MILKIGDTSRGGKKVAIVKRMDMVKEEIDGTHLHQQQSTPPALLIIFMNDFKFLMNILKEI